ncbi:hypothetical protein E2C01_061112 [Portunus trituberculatus]|uniref:Uncharacterized protein n=1 Tax=Portunus trituberculatus TaxID=210409 RepID=A0A5B7H9W0_PORTR|nr:hypothetical protein [Portunus trituberculatus]
MMSTIIGKSDRSVPHPSSHITGAVTQSTTGKPPPTDTMEHFNGQEERRAALNTDNIFGLVSADERPTNHSNS